MANKLEKMIEYLINEDEDKARALFHDYVIEQSRKIYESIIDEEGYEEDDFGEFEDDIDGDERGLSFEDEDYEDDDFIGGDEQDDFVDDVEVDVEDDMGDDLEMDMDMDMEQDVDFDDSGDLDDHEEMHGDDSDRLADAEDAIDDLADAFEELKAEFDAMNGGEDDFESDEDESDEDEADDDDDDEFGESVDLEEDELDEDDEVVREYIEKVQGDPVKDPATKSEESGTQTKSTVAGKNDMGGTAKNIAQGADAKGGKADHGSMQSNKPKAMGKRWENEAGAKAGVKHLKKRSDGHGAEKKGKSEQAANKTSTIGSKRNQGKS